MSDTGPPRNRDRTLLKPSFLQRNGLQLRPRGEVSPAVVDAPVLSLPVEPVAATTGTVSVPTTGPPVHGIVCHAGDTHHLDAYLAQRENGAAEIAKLHAILTMPQVLFELGCGCGEVAMQIAAKNPTVGVLAVDKYDWDGPSDDGSHYRSVAAAWRARALRAQERALENLVLLRAEADLLDFLPPHAIDTILMVNPEPSVGRWFLESVAATAWRQTLKGSDKQIVVVPFSRELGQIACGGYEFEHASDWSRGLGFMMDSPLAFRRGERLHWGVDLGSASPYSKNSTCTDVYIYGDQHRPATGSTWAQWFKKIF